MLELLGSTTTPPSKRWRTRWWIYASSTATGTAYKTGTGLTALKTALTADLMAKYDALTIVTKKEYY